MIYEFQNSQMTLWTMEKAEERRNIRRQKWVKSLN